MENVDISLVLAIFLSRGLETFGFGPWTLDLAININVDISLVLEAFLRACESWIWSVGLFHLENVDISLVLDTLLSKGL